MKTFLINLLMILLIALVILCLNENTEVGEKAKVSKKTNEIQRIDPGLLVMGEYE